MNQSASPMASMSENGSLNSKADVSADPFAFPSVPVPSQMSQTQGGTIQVVEVGASHKGLYLGIFLLALAALFGLYQALIHGLSPYDQLVELITGQTPPSDAGSKMTDSAPSTEQEATSPEGEHKQKNILEPLPGNPYWILPNVNLTLASDRGAGLGEWTIDREASIREGLTHRFVYQHYKAVQEIRRNRWQGSEVELKKALYAKKFWTRMFAAIGLAEMGFTIPLIDLDRLIQGERSELISGFFERFIEKPDSGQAYIFRQMIRLVDARARLVLLDGIAKIKDPFTPIYLEAAARDSNVRVREKAEKLLRALQLDDSERRNIAQIIEGGLDGKEYLSQKGVHRFEARLPKAQKVQQSSGSKIITDADIDQELQDMMADPGEVEVYEVQ